MNFAFSKIFNENTIQKIADLLLNSAGISASIIDSEANSLGGSVNTSICSENQINLYKECKFCLKSNSPLSKISLFSPSFQMHKCSLGMCLATIPIQLENEQRALIVTGQFFNRKPDLEFIRKETATLPIDQEVLLNKIAAMPVITEARIRSLLEHMVEYSELIVDKDETKKKIAVALKAEIQAEHAKQDLLLKDSHKFLQSLIDTMPNPVFYKNRHGYYLSCNKAFLEFTGLDKNQIIGATSQDIYPKSTAALIHQYENILLSEGGTVTFEMESKHADGSDREIMVYISKIINEENNITGIIGTFIDFTERVHYENDLRNAKEKAEESDKLKSAFLANMSHEIRTPMNGIMGFAELLSKTDKATDQQKRYSDIIVGSCKRLLNIINDILDISRIEAGKINVQETNFSVPLLMEEVYLLFQGQISTEKRHLQLEMKIENKNAIKDLIIYTDEGRLRQVLTNLIGNAIKFTEEGKIEFGYKIGADNKSLDFYVKDTGIGIPKEKLKVIFERFRQVEEVTTKQYGGTGLGLSIAKGLLQIMNGKIWVESIEGKGSTFYFTIPYIMQEGKK